MDCPRKESMFPTYHMNGKAQICKRSQLEPKERNQLQRKFSDSCLSLIYKESGENFDSLKKALLQADISQLNESCKKLFFQLKNSTCRLQRIKAVQKFIERELQSAERDVDSSKLEGQLELWK